MHARCGQKKSSAMIKIKIDTDTNCILGEKEVQYIFETICITIGIPWNFVDKEQNDKIDIYYGKIRNNEATLSIMATTKEHPNPGMIKYKELLFLESLDRLSDDPYVLDSGKCAFNNDIIYNSFYFLTGKDESNIERNRWDQHNIKQSILYKNNALQIPIINEYSNFIKKLFSDQFEFIPAWPNDKKAALGLAHDVDYPEMIKPIEILRYVLKYKFNSKIRTIWDIIIGKETFWKFEDFMNLEQKYNMKSVFYFCSFKGSLPRYFLKAPDPFYNIKKSKYKSIVKKMMKSGFEVGLQSSYFAFESLQRFKGESEKLKQEFELSEIGHRHHYWHTNPEDPSETCAIHEEAGLAYDSSMSFEQHSGFRYSICTPFHMWDKQKKTPLNILQLPPTLMDDHLFGYSSLSAFESYEENIDNLINAIKNNNGLFIADFHARVLNNTFYPKWGEAYEYLLKQIQNSGQFYIDTPMNIQKHWTERELLIRNKSKK